MTPDQYKLIVEYANGDGSLRQEAVKIFTDELRRACLLRNEEQSEIMDTKAMKFMSEVDNKCPDFNLRSIYRNQLLEEAEKKGVIKPQEPETKTFHPRRPPDLKVTTHHRRRKGK